MREIIQCFNSEIQKRGLKLTKVSDYTEIEYQRLIRILNGNVNLKASDFLRLCKFLDINPRIFVKSA